MSWKGLVSKLGPAFVLSTSITIGLTAIGLMGYSNALARDRDKGIFQRLRVAPIPTSYIMISRLAVQMAMIILLTTLVFVVGYQRLHIELPAQSYAMGFFAAFAGGALYLGLGQMIAGLVKNSETVNSTTRLVYFVFIMVGNQIQKIVHWSPWGTVKTIVSSALQTAGWNNEATTALLLTTAYALVFAFLGIKWFRWNVK